MELPEIRITRPRISLLLAIVTMIGVVAGGGAKIALSKADLDDVELRTAKLETMGTARDLKMQELSTKLDDVIAGVSRIEDRMDRAHP